MAEVNFGENLYFSWSGHNGPKIWFLKVFRKFYHHFAISNLKWKILWFSIFVCVSYFLENYSSQDIGQNALVKSDKILWSSISLEEIKWYLTFLHGDCHYRKVAIKTITFGWAWPAVLSQAQTCLDLSRCFSLVLGYIQVGNNT